MTQQPTVGRIVIYAQGVKECEQLHVPKGTNGTRHHPAIITRVWSPSCVNLQVFWDGGEASCVSSARMIAHPASSDAGAPQDSGWYWPPISTPARSPDPTPATEIDITSLVSLRMDRIHFRAQPGLVFSKAQASALARWLSRLAGTPPGPVLMSSENPTGWKLEELLRQIIVELDAKTARLQSGEHTQAVRQNNLNALLALRRALQLQEATLAILSSTSAHGTSSERLGVSPGAPNPSRS